MKKLSVIFVFLAVLILVTGTASAISNGRPDGNDHPYVGVVSDLELSCSGFAISPTVFVTAAHCFDGPVGKPVFVSFVPEPQTAADFTFGAWFPHPEFCRDCGNNSSGTRTHDIAVVQLFFPVSLPRYAELPAIGAVDDLPNKSPMDLVGYGAQFDSGGGPRVPYDGGLTRYFAEAQLIPSNHRISDEYIKVSANPGRGKGGACFGDSGGPNFLSGTNKVVAINSYGTNGNCAGVTYSNRIDLDYALDFINDFSP